MRTLRQISCAALLAGLAISEALAGDEAFITQVEVPTKATSGANCTPPACVVKSGTETALLPAGNSVTLLQQGESNYSNVTQQGGANAVDIAIIGSNNINDYRQTGAGNYANARVNGSGNDFTVSQNGSDRSLIVLDGNNYRVEHDLTGDVPAEVETSVTGTLSGPIEVTNSQWGRITVESK